MADCFQKATLSRNERVLTRSYRCAPRQAWGGKGKRSRRRVPADELAALEAAWGNHAEEGCNHN